MGYLHADNGYVGIGVQTSSLTTAQTPGIFQTVESADVKYENPGGGVIKGIRRSRNNHIAVKGGIVVEGSIAGPLIPDEFFGHSLLAHIFGNYNTVSGSGTVGYTHTFNQPRVGTDADNPAYGSTLEILMGDNIAASSSSNFLKQLVGCFVKKLTISGKFDEALKVTTEWTGANQVDGGTVSAPTFSTKNPFEGRHCDLLIGTAIGSVASVPIKSFSISIENGATMVRGLNSRYPIGVSWGTYKVTVDFEYDLTNDRTLIDYYKNATDVAIQLSMTHDQLAGSSSGYYAMNLFIPRIRPTGDMPALSGEGLISNKFVGTAYYDPTTSKTISATLVNSISGTIAV